MIRFFSGLALAALVAGIQLGTSGSASAAVPLTTETTYKCIPIGICTTPIPDRREYECAEGLLKHCSEGSDSQGCKWCKATSIATPQPH